MKTRGSILLQEIEDPYLLSFSLPSLIFLSGPFEMSNVKMFSSLCPFLHVYHFPYKTIPISYFPNNIDLKITHLFPFPTVYFQ